MPSIKLTYFPIAGRLAPIKVALALKDMPFEVEAIGFEEWAKVKDDRKRFPLGDIPTLTVDGVVVAETAAIITYAGALTGLWPTAPLDTAVAIELLSTIEQFFTGAPAYPGDYNFIATLPLEDEELRAARAGPVTERAKYYFGRVNEIVGRNVAKGGFAVGDKLTIIDIWVMYNWYGFTTSHFEHIDPAIANEWTHIAALVKKLEGDEKFMQVFLHQTADATTETE